MKSDGLRLGERGIMTTEAGLAGAVDQQSNAVDSEVRAEAKEGSRLSSLLLGSLERFSGLYAMAIIIAVFSLWIPHTFLTKTTWQSLLSEQAVTAMLAFGLLFPLSAGVFDLSIAAILGFSEVMAAWLQGMHQVNSFLAAAITLLLCCLIGGVNAIAVIKFRVSSFIATLGMSSVLAALVVAITHNEEVISGVSTTYQKIGNKIPLDIPIVAYYMVALGLIVWWIMDRTPKGRFLAAVGGNQEAARLAGLPVNRYIASSFVISAFLGGLAGLIYLAQIGSGSQDAGPPFLLPTFAAVFLGATQVRPGRFNVPGTLIAVFLLAIGVKGLQLVGAADWVSNLFDGGALIIAVALANVRRKAGTQIT